MLVPSKVSWWRLVFAYKGSELPRTKYRIAGVLIVSIFVTILEELHDWHPNLKPLPFTLVGVALGIFLGFRNNASYDRWWEGRKLWGALVNTTRTFTRQVLTIIGTQPDGARVDEGELRAFQREIVLRIAAFAHALRLALRDEDDLAQLAPFLPAEEIEQLRKESNRPFAITQGTAERIRAAWQRGWIHTMHLPVLEQSMTSLTDIQGGCERIKATPIPFSYTTLIHRITAVYCYVLPFGLVDEIGIYTPFAVGIVAYAFFGLDVVGDEIEMPFGTDPNDLPLRAISRMIEVNLRQRIDDPEPPPLLRPVDEILD
ncbi:bestrophin family protein [Sandaracinus amylolyticus]|uniref:Putative membrane protein n=1 Tax=Sandaracinus amylolyticus TaxID=927083 RepID=A0A0F6W523_9BACT|nr:bestrophin family protein [Sandaracinus amylolyticus]AKF07681.1 putative membrane protein [Sandaracinus amylolyticus]